MKTISLYIDYLTAPTGVDNHSKLSFTVDGEGCKDKQFGYRYQVAKSEDFAKICFDSGCVLSQKRLNIPLTQLPLEEVTKYYLRLGIFYKDDDDFTGFCPPTSFITAKKRWDAPFVSPEKEGEEQSDAKYMRTTFEVAGEVDSAYLISTALGLCNTYINGEKTDDYLLAPGFTSYNRHLLYQTREVTHLLKQGENCLGALVGVGWYKGTFGFLGLKDNYGNRTAFACELFVNYKDGSKRIISTHDTFLCSSSPIKFSEIYDGEIYDARYEIADWCEAHYTPNGWYNATRVDYTNNNNNITAQKGGYVKVMETLPATQILTTPKGERVIDFAQNLTGFVKFKKQGKKGDVLKLKCFEVLDSEGNAYFDNLRKAKQEITYICKGDEGGYYTPHFTFQGFRYALLEGFGTQVKKEDFRAQVVYSNMEQTYTFECSNPLINKLVQNTYWSMKGNFLDIPTDCPQRNERVGWTGDAQIFCGTACYLANSHEFFKKWLVDLAVDQQAVGGVPHIVPDVISSKVGEVHDWLVSRGTHSAAAWGDAAVIIPWTLYKFFGDEEILKTQYQSMKDWVEFMIAHRQGGSWKYRLQLGDWVALDAQEGSYFGATKEELVCSAYFAYCSKLLGQTAEILHIKEDAEKYMQIHKEVVEWFNKEYINGDGSLNVPTQTAHILALHFDLVADKTPIINGLTDLLAKEKGHLVTGFVGTPYFCHALSDNGKEEEAYNLLLQEDYPSWLYQIKMGATTIWEHWDGIKPNGSMWSADMNSFNHYAYGAVCEWIFKNIGGIGQAENSAGFKNIVINGNLGGGLTYSKAKYKSIRGDICVEKYVEDKKIIFNVKIPHDAQATLMYKQEVIGVLGQGNHNLEVNL